MGFQDMKSQPLVSGRIEISAVIHRLAPVAIGLFQSPMFLSLLDLPLSQVAKKRHSLSFIRY